MKEKDFISFWLQTLQKEGVKEFPDDFIFSEDFSEIAMPGKALILGKEFFGSYEILTVDSVPFYQVQNIHRAKYIIYSNRSFPKSIKIPLNEKEISSSVLAYENYIDSLIRLLGSDYKKKFPGEKNRQIVINNVLLSLNLVRY